MVARGSDRRDPTRHPRLYSTPANLVQIRTRQDDGRSNHWRPIAGDAGRGEACFRASRVIIKDVRTRATVSWHFPCLVGCFLLLFYLLTFTGAVGGKDSDGRAM